MYSLRVVDGTKMRQKNGKRFGEVKKIMQIVANRDVNSKTICVVVTSAQSR